MIEVDGMTVVARAEIPTGHKIALQDIGQGEAVLKYGGTIGHATALITAGEWVHSHNLATNLDTDPVYDYQPAGDALAPGQPTESFNGFQRANGLVGIRNDLFIVPTVGCINGMADAMGRQFERQHPSVFDSVIVTRHPYGCSQLGGDLEMTRLILQDVIKHPNAGGVLVVGLGCENNQLGDLRDSVGDYNPDRVKFLVSQQVDDELSVAAGLLDELAEVARDDYRTSVPLSALKIGLKCGGSDGFSGITANPLLGRFSEYVVSQGGCAVLSEVPEMFGAEQILMSRARDEGVFRDVVGLITGFKDYFHRYGQPIYENPSPGNKQGGITTLEEKSLGCTQKAGRNQVEDVLSYGQTIRQPGLSLLQGPGNDMVSSSALASAGCQLVLFTTGRGTPFGTYVPTIKVSSNSALAAAKSGWIDFDAGVLLERPMDDVLPEFIDLVMHVVEGQPARNEINLMQEIAIFKDGVTE